ncbi:MAG: SDR family oxidoreductase [Spirochaetia bacterium]|nr:SDR family oxidoreductase [Spirochaetia bacterium]
MSDSEEIRQQDIDTTISLLKKLTEDGAKLAGLTEEQKIALLKAAGQFAHPDRKELKKRNREIKKEEHRQNFLRDKAGRASTGIRTARAASVFVAPKMLSAPEARMHEDDYTELSSPRNCYICKEMYTRLHHFYDQLCPKCAEYNYQKRFQTADLSGQVAVITGSRLKIGYQATLMMLRAGATVIATTRFPHDSALRFSKEPDFSEWGHRLHVYGLDLRHTPSVEIFCRYVEQNYPRLDILINNAAQTVRRPAAFYAHLIPNETKPVAELPPEARTVLEGYQDCVRQLESFSAAKDELDHGAGKAIQLAWNSKKTGIGITSSAMLSQIPYTIDNSLATEEVFPAGKLDADLQQVDMRETNSWRLTLGEISTVEMLELQLVNAVAPFVLCNRLVPMMKKEYTGMKHIINVSAMEGKFLRFQKGARHPHTNMAKAALNMLTHTSAGELAKYGIFMNAVDTGWVTDEDPAKLAALKQEMHDFQPPLDIVDGAARVLDPLFSGINTGVHTYGKFLKDYFPIDW